MITNAAAYLWDMQRAAERIVRFTAGRSFDDYLADEMLSAAVERQFEIIGEAPSVCGALLPRWPRQFPACCRSSGFATC